MATKDDYIEKIRLDLDDADGSKWEDPEIESYLEESVSRYSKNFPRTRQVEFSGDGITNIFDAPSDLLDNWVNYMWIVTPQGHLREIQPKNLRMRYPEKYFEVIDDQIILSWTPNASDTLRIRYSAIYEVPETGDLAIPVEDKEFIYLWAMHLAWRKTSLADASLSRWTEGKKRDDSPIIPIFMILEREYDRLVDEKKSRGKFLVRRRVPRGFTSRSDPWQNQ